MAAGVGYELRTLVDEESLERYQRRAPAGNVVDEEFLPPELESASFRYFTDAGSVTGGDTLFFEGTLSIEEAGETGFNVPTDNREGRFNGEQFIADCAEITDNNPETGCDVNVWSVVRDGRLGVDFARRTFLATGVKP